MIPSASFLKPEWSLPEVSEHVCALMTTRQGGFSSAPFDSLNLRFPLAGEKGGDNPQAVERNHQQLASALTAKPVWLNQVHGARVVRIGLQDALPQALIEERPQTCRFAPGPPRGVRKLGSGPAFSHEADASVTNHPGVACAVQVADCLPVLFTAPQGRAVGAAHAGWRGLAAGVLEATVAEICAAASCDPAEVQAWLGACIGPQHFEVGGDVLRAFKVNPDLCPAESGFVPAAKPGKWLADLCHLARSRLQAAGLRAISGGHWCTFSEPERFFSFRRDRLTGRMAAVIQRV